MIYRHTIKGEWHAVQRELDCLREMGWSIDGYGVGDNSVTVVKFFPPAIEPKDYVGPDAVSARQHAGMRKAMLIPALDANCYCCYWPDYMFLALTSPTRLILADSDDYICEREFPTAAEAETAFNEIVELGPQWVRELVEVYQLR